MSIDIRKLQADWTLENRFEIRDEHDECLVSLCVAIYNPNNNLHKLMKVVVAAFNEKVASIKLLQGVNLNKFEKELNKLEKEFEEEERKKEKHGKT